MNRFQVIRRSDGAPVYEYQHDERLELDLFPSDEYDHVLVPAQPTQNPTRYGGRRWLTKVEFVDLIGPQAYVAILAMAKNAPEIEAWVKLMELATPNEDGTSVNLDDRRTIDGVHAIGAVLVAAGVVTEGWAEEVLRG